MKIEKIDIDSWDEFSTREWEVVGRLNQVIDAFNSLGEEEQEYGEIGGKLYDKKTGVQIYPQELEEDWEKEFDRLYHEYSISGGFVPNVPEEGHYRINPKYVKEFIQETLKKDRQKLKAAVEKLPKDTAEHGYVVYKNDVLHLIKGI